jgi:hypothetical protein
MAAIRRIDPGPFIPRSSKDERRRIDARGQGLDPEHVRTPRLASANRARGK